MTPNSQKIFADLNLSGPGRHRAFRCCFEWCS